MKVAALAAVVLGLAGPFVACMAFLICDLLFSSWASRNFPSQLTDLLRTAGLLSFMQPNLFDKCPMAGVQSVVLSEISCWLIVVFDIGVTLSLMRRDDLRRAYLSISAVVGVGAKRFSPSILLFVIGVIVFGLIDRGLWASTCDPSKHGQELSKLLMYLVPGLYMTAICNIVKETIHALIIKHFQATGGH